MSKVLDALLPVLAVVFSIGGIAGFAYLFLRELNVFWLVVAPIIFAMYQIPAAGLWWLWKKRKREREGKKGEEKNESGGGPTE